MKALRLHNNDFVQVAGPDCKKFLQGQVSCNMDLLSPTQSLTGVLCNLKGRVIADFRAIEVADNVWLQTEAGMGQRLIDVLAKYAVFSKVEITMLNAISSVIGVQSAPDSSALRELLGPLPTENNSAIASDALAVIRLPMGVNTTADRFEIIGISPDADTVVNSLIEQAGSISEAEWQRLDIEAGVIHVRVEDSEEFTPQLLNYDLSGVIDFKKGCYTGQEIVARMFYRSTAKKRLYLLSSPLPVSADDAIVYWEKNKESRAKVLRFSNHTHLESPTLILAIIGTEAENADSPPQLSSSIAGKTGSPSNNADSSLQFLTLPYTG